MVLQGYPLSQSDSRATHYSNRAFQKSVDASTGNLIVPQPIVAEELNKRGFLVAQFSTFQDIADVRSFLSHQPQRLCPLRSGASTATWRGVAGKAVPGSPSPMVMYRSWFSPIKTSH